MNAKPKPCTQTKALGKGAIASTSLPGQRAVGGLRVLLGSCVMSVGLAAWGALVSTIPGQFSTAVAFERTIPSAPDSESPPPKETIWDDLLNSSALGEVLRTTPVPEGEQLGDKAELALRARTAIALEVPENGRQRIIVRVSCSKAETSERLGRAIVDRFLAGKTPPSSKSFGKSELASAEAACLSRAKALADGQARLESLRSTEANSSAQSARDELAQIRNEIASAAALKSEVELAVHEAPANAPIANSSSESTDDNTLAHQALREVYRQRAELVATFTDKHPAIRSLDRKVRELSETAGIANVDSWIKRESAIEVVATPSKARPVDPGIQRVNAIEQKVDSLRRRERELTEVLAEESARDSAAAKQLEEVKILQKAWHDALAAKRQLLESSAIALPCCDSGYRRCPGLLESVRYEGPNRGVWFCVGGACWLLGCGFSCFGRKSRSSM